MQSCAKNRSISFLSKKKKSNCSDVSDQIWCCGKQTCLDILLSYCAPVRTPDADTYSKLWCLFRVQLCAALYSECSAWWTGPPLTWCPDPQYQLCATARTNETIQKKLNLMSTKSSPIVFEWVLYILLKSHAPDDKNIWYSNVLKDQIYFYYYHQCCNVKWRYQWHWKDSVALCKIIAI